MVGTSEYKLKLVMFFCSVLLYWNSFFIKESLFCYFKQSTFVLVVALKRRHSGVNLSFIVTIEYYWLSYMLTIPDSISDNNYLELVLNEKHQTQQTDTFFT